MQQRLSQEELSKRLAEAARLVTVGAQYMHYKSKPYKVLNLALTEETNEVCVIYQAQYANKYGDKLTFIRPLQNWIEDVEWEGKQLKRFTPIT